MKTILGEILFETGEVASLGDVHPTTVRDWVRDNPTWGRMIGGRSYLTVRGLKEALSITDAQVEMAIAQCKSGRIKSGAMA